MPVPRTACTISPVALERLHPSSGFRPGAANGPSEACLNTLRFRAIQAHTLDRESIGPLFWLRVAFRAKRACLHFMHEQCIGPMTPSSAWSFAPTRRARGDAMTAAPLPMPSATHPLAPSTSLCENPVLITLSSCGDSCLTTALFTLRRRPPCRDFASLVRVNQSDYSRLPMAIISVVLVCVCTRL